MYNLDPYLVERTMQNRIQESQRESKMYRLCKEAGVASLGRLPELGRRLMRESGQALEALGAWLAEQGTASEQPFDGQVEASH
jgi:hypothetical protein